MSLYSYHLSPQRRFCELKEKKMNISSSFHPLSQLVSKATRFLSVVVRMPSQRGLFENDATLEAFCEKIVLPNMMLRGMDRILILHNRHH